MAAARITIPTMPNAAAPELDRCPVCDTGLGVPLDSLQLTTPRGTATWARCPSCGSFFLVAPWDRELELRHTLGRPWGSPASGIALNEHKRRMHGAILRTLSRHAGTGAALLDVGCSYGGFLERARELGYRVRGLDIVPQAVDHVRGRGIPCDLAASVAELGLPDGSLGVVTVLDCSYYWPRQRPELRAIRAALAPGGVLALRVVDASWVVRAGFRLRRWAPAAARRLCARAVYDHRVSIPTRSLLRLLGEEGFDVVHVSLRDAVPSAESSLKLRAAYVAAHLLWRTAGWYLAPGCVILARRAT